jgi:hypothetical protein
MGATTDREYINAEMWPHGNEVGGCETRNIASCRGDYLVPWGIDLKSCYEIKKWVLKMGIIFEICEAASLS